MKDSKLKKAIFATTVATVVGISLYIGSIDPKTGFPTPITVDGVTTEFTWTDDNTDEDLIIYTDKANYSDSLSSATVYVAVENRSGVAQDVNLEGYFEDSKRSIEDMYVLTQSDREIKEPVVTENCVAMKTSGTSTDQECTQETSYTITTVTDNKWLPLEKFEKTDVRIEEKDIEKLAKLKSVESFKSDKSFQFPIEVGEVIYFKAEIKFPANDNTNFYFEAIGSAGAYGHLDPWFDADWQYRKLITINAETGAGTGYQVKLQVGDSSGGDFHLEGNSLDFPTGKNDSGDIRFTADDGDTELDFWVESVTSGVADIWVEVTDDLSTTDVDIYVYYGATGASNVSDGDATFPEFFEDFDVADNETDEWVFYRANAEIVETLANVNIADSKFSIDLPGSVSDAVRFTTKNNWGDDYAVRGLVQLPSTPVSSHAFGFIYQGMTGYVPYWPATGKRMYGIFYNTWNFGSNDYRYFDEQIGTSASLNLGATFANSMKILEVQRLSGGDLKFLVDDTLYQNPTNVISSDADNSAVTMYYYDRSTGSAMEGDYILIRKVVDTEPSFSLAGAEEEDVASEPEEEVYINGGTLKVNNGIIIIN